MYGRGLSSLWVVFASLLSCRTASGPPITPELVERNNRAVGLMGQFDFNAAVDAFDGAFNPRHPIGPRPA